MPTGLSAFLQPKDTAMTRAQRTTRYSILRSTREHGGYCYDLLDHKTGHIGPKDVLSKQPIAPQWLRNLQAKLNTREYLDKMGVF